MAVAISRTATGGIGSSGGIVNTGSISIGTASFDRIVVLACTAEQTNASQTSATIDYGAGDTAMTALTQSAFGTSEFSRIFYLPVPSGANATFKITYNAAVTSAQNQYSVYSVTGAALTLVGSGVNNSTDMDASTPLTTGSISFSGGFIGVAACSVGTTTSKTWTNATEDQEVNPGAYTHTTATRTASLTATAITVTGSNNGEDGALAWMSFKPGWFINPDAGSYSLSGTAAALTLGHRSGQQAAGSYAITGTNATLSLGHRSGLEDAGSYALTGSVASNIHVWKSTVDAGSYALTGIDVTLAKGQRTTADVGSYSISGGDISAEHGWLLQTDSGSYIFTGTDAAFRRSTIIKPDSGTYNLTGTDASLLKSWKLGADAGNYAVNGSNADLLIRSDKFIGATSGSYVISGTPATLINNKLIVVDSGSYQIGGQAVGIIPSGGATQKGFRGLLALWMGGASGITKPTRGLRSLLAFWMGGGGSAAEQISLPYSGPPPPKRIIVINGVVPGEEFVIRFSVNPGLAVASGILAATASGGAMTKEALVLAQNAIKSGLASGEKNLSEEELFILSQIV